MGVAASVTDLGYMVDFILSSAFAPFIVILLPELANLESWVTQHHRKMFPRCFVQ